MKRYLEEVRGFENVPQLKRFLEEAEILRSGMRLALMNPFLDSEHRVEYKEVFLKLNDKIRELKTMVNGV
jgi:hypothetical protein